MGSNTTNNLNLFIFINFIYQRFITAKIKFLGANLTVCGISHLRTGAVGWA